MAGKPLTRNGYHRQASLSVIPIEPSYFTPTALTGTCESSDKYVTGTGTLFLSEIADVDANGNQRATDLGYLYDGAAILVKIIGVVDDTHLVLKNAPSSVLSLASCYLVKTPRIKQLSIIGGSNDGSVNGEQLPENLEITYEQDYNGQLLEPMIVGNVYYAVRW